MAKKIVLICIVVLSLCASSAFAADVKQHFSIQDAKNYSSVKDVYAGDIGLYWGDQKHSKVLSNKGTFKTSKRTNGFMKENQEACAHALASALIVFQDRARKEGGNAVINLTSNIKNVEESSETEYSCLVGSIMVNVALKGTVVSLKK